MAIGPAFRRYLAVCLLAMAAAFSGLGVASDDDQPLKLSGGPRVVSAALEGPALPASPSGLIWIAQNSDDGGAVLECYKPPTQLFTCPVNEMCSNSTPENPTCCCVASDDSCGPASDMLCCRNTLDGACETLCQNHRATCVGMPVYDGPPMPVGKSP